MNPSFWQLCCFSQGRIQARNLEELKDFIQNLVSINDELSESEVVKTLVELRHTKIKTENLDQEFRQIEGALRCYISQQIKVVCLGLNQRYGERHCFRVEDLYPLVLLDTPSQILNQSRNIDARYVPFSLQILNRFEPEKGELKSWTYKLAQEHPEIKGFLAECGVIRITDWAILNATKVVSLRKILVESPGIHAPIPETDLKSQEALLNCYHHIYRRDRIQSEGTHSRKTCEPPREEQLQRIANEFEQVTTQVISTTVVKQNLLKLAESIRKYKVARRGGRIDAISLDEKRGNDSQESMLDMIASPTQSDEDKDQEAYADESREQFVHNASVAIQETVEIWVEKRKRKGKESLYLLGLRKFHCEGRLMGELAAELGFKPHDQVGVTRLLKLTDLRSDVGQKLLILTTESTMNQASKYLDPDLLLKRYEAIIAALKDQIDAFIKKAKDEASMPKNRTCNSLFSRLLCQYLDTRLKP